MNGLCVQTFIRIIVACFTTLALPVRGASEPTAFDLAKEGNRYLGEQSKGKVVQIRSEKSINGLVPNTWFVVYFDPTATFKATEVKFGAGQMLEVKRPWRMLEMAADNHKQLPMEKLKIDSPRAIKIATGEPLLGKLNLKAVKLELERWEGQSVWKVRLWAAKLAEPNQQADIGEVFVSAEDGKVVKNGLKINRVD